MLFQSLLFRLMDLFFPSGDKLMSKNDRKRKLAGEWLTCVWFPQHEMLQTLILTTENKSARSIKEHCFWGWLFLVCLWTFSLSYYNLTSTSLSWDFWQPSCFSVNLLTLEKTKPQCFQSFLFWGGWIVIGHIKCKLLLCKLCEEGVLFL